MAHRSSPPLPPRDPLKASDRPRLRRQPGAATTACAGVQPGRVPARLALPPSVKQCSHPHLNHSTPSINGDCPYLPRFLPVFFHMDVRRRATSAARRPSRSAAPSVATCWSGSFCIVEEIHLDGAIEHAPNIGGFLKSIPVPLSSPILYYPVALSGILGRAHFTKHLTRHQACHQISHHEQSSSHSFMQSIKPSNSQST